MLSGIAKDDAQTLNPRVGQRGADFRTDASPSPSPNDGGYKRGKEILDNRNLNRLRNKCAMTRSAKEAGRKCAFTLAEVFSTHSAGYRKAAFTLAEVLITLGIIGVVAAMTLPTLITNYKEKQIVTQLMKEYSVLAQAWQMVQTEYGELSTWGLENTFTTGDVDPETGKNIYSHSAQSLIAERLKKYLNVSRTCKLGEVCYPNTAFNLNGTTYLSPTPMQADRDSPPEASFFLNDGTFITLGWYEKIKTLNYFPKGYVDIRVTLPDTKRPVMGKHIFYFKAGDKGVLPEGDEKTIEIGQQNSLFDKYCKLTDSGRGCSAWIIYNKNLDYLHCREKLGWDKALSCKD